MTGVTGEEASLETHENLSKGFLSLWERDRVRTMECSPGIFDLVPA